MHLIFHELLPHSISGGPCGNQAALITNRRHKPRKSGPRSRGVRSARKCRFGHLLTQLLTPLVAEMSVVLWLPVNDAIRTQPQPLFQQLCPFRAAISTTSLTSSPRPQSAQILTAPTVSITPSHALHPRPNNLPLRLHRPRRRPQLSPLFPPHPRIRPGILLPPRLRPPGHARQRTRCHSHGSVLLSRRVPRERAFFIATVPMRLLTAIVFGRHQGVWKTASLWEGFGAILTLGALIMAKERKGTKGLERD